MVDSLKLAIICYSGISKTTYCQVNNHLSSFLSLHLVFINITFSLYLKIYPIKQKTCLKLVIGTLEHISWTYFKPLFNISLVRLEHVNAGGLFHSRVISITAITTIKKLCYIDFWRFSSGTMTSSEHLSDSMTS